MNRTAATGLLLACLTLTACGSGVSGSPVGVDSAPTTSEKSSASAQATSAGDGTPCRYKTSTGQPAPEGKDVGKPAERAKDKPATVTLTTNLGAIAITLATDTAPCTSRSIAHLAAKKYFDDSPCHRLTAAESLSVLQCGDPTGQGTGGPGYTVQDENPGNLKPSGVGETVIYPRGTVAMANTGRPNSGGSQFFLVYRDSKLPPTYAVLGTVDDKGLAVLDKIAAGGVTPQMGEQDGAPTVPVKIQKATVED
ncbi:peptidyl-prolyl cis-trans isomerase B (cyclophilin B) [Actinokineospora alba]|uniref:Peptidyl-prolyl cis-trans isomerase B (Cyclophilin B) n=1 Tax=Actinokineospora alba TaxID=504798 RepID=A0A1H0TMH9_9PSEU|nr:peptidylprolyl isomerase [Actinokineospora alba]TDP70608.1 peptidyl-prolyl cis-trans isomerase B (cyclophilin B) [Actinokineospora alba]SDJ11563.1 peptidyl-prolyl cis-trans isomerase B (cyclophilin B) [Actinokineospora alba]SDP55247.1 peptidyl-prolyl cis-trans isomerase B (cyclophilin B) [Actinokineospora alba]